LIELLFAMAIVVAIALTLVHSLQVAFRSREVAERSLETGRSADVVMGILKNDFQCALPPRGVFAGTFEAQSGTQANGSDDIIFYTTAPAPVRAPNQVAMGNGELKQIELTVSQPAGSNDIVLVRRTLNNLLSQNQQNDIDEEVICRHVVSFTAQYCDATGVWDTSWDSTAATPVNTLPTGVQVKLVLQSPLKNPDGSQQTVTYQRVFEIPAYGPSNDTTSTGTVSGGIQ
jgi:type II secretory pathway component PulJ